MLTYKIISGDSREVKAIPSNSIHFSITSPPYQNIKEYNREDANNIGNYSSEQYFNMIEKVYREVYRVLKPGRKFVINVPYIGYISNLDNNRCLYPLGLYTIELCQKIGFVLTYIVYWNQGRSSCSKNIGSYPYPGSPVILNEVEECYVFRKPGEPDYSHVTSQEREISKMDKETYKNLLYSLWDIQPENNYRDHPCPYPIKLAENFIRIYTFFNETVYDPFLGSGTTIRAAKNLHRSAIGCELGFKTLDGTSWLEVIKRRVGWNEKSLFDEEIVYEIINTDGTRIHESVKGLGKYKRNEIVKLSNYFENIEDIKQNSEEIINGEVTNWRKVFTDSKNQTKLFL